MIDTDLLEDRVELVDAAGQPTGWVGRLDAHRAPGRRHSAFSVFLFDPDGRLLLQRRAARTLHSPGMWSNSCSGHPRPGEAPEQAVRRRVWDELGMMAYGLARADTIGYRLTDPMSGLVEDEHNHVFVGRTLDTPMPDPSCVADAAMVTTAQLGRLLAREAFEMRFETVARVAMAFAPDLLPAFAGRA